MERRKKRWAAIRAMAFALLRVLLLAVLGAGLYFGTKYIFKRSDLEVNTIKTRPKPEWAMEVNQPIRMTVIDDKGQKTAEISGDSVKLTLDQKTAIFTNAHVETFEDGQFSLRMEAQHVEYNTQTEDIVLKDGLKIETRDGMTAVAETVEWHRAKEYAGQGAKSPSFRFSKGVDITTSEGNRLHADYMQADRELMYMECVGHVNGDIQSLQDTKFIRERSLAQTNQLKLEDFKKLRFSAEEVIYDKNKQVMLATSRFYAKAFNIRDFDGRTVNITQYQREPQQVTFSKEGITIAANHLEAHISKEWARCLGNIGMIIPPSTPKADDDKAMQVVKRYEARIQTEDVEYFWGADHIITHTPTRVEQEDRLALADSIVYWGAQKEVLLDGNITVVQGSGDWMVDEGLIEASNHDMRRAVTAYSELYAERAVIYLNNNDFVASGSVRTRQDERETSADTIVYQDTIKRITALGNVKFRDKDGQTLLCNNLVFHNQSKFLEIKDGMAATMRLPAKYANDINRALSQAREQEVPPEIADPPVEPNRQHRNPNEGSTAGRNVEPVPADRPEGLMPLSIPGVPDIASEGLGPDTPGGGAEGLRDALDLFAQPGKAKTGGEEDKKKDDGAQEQNP